MDPIPWGVFFQLIAQLLLVTFTASMCIYVVISAILSAVANYRATLYRQMFREHREKKE